jgi:ubiquitin C-terminal hydrolase
MKINSKIQKKIIESKIDIEALNEFIQYEEEGKKFKINKDGQLICEELDRNWFRKIWNKIYNLIIEILKNLKLYTEEEKKEICGLINIGNNCYLNAGLQILSRCYPLVKVLLESNYQEDKLMKLFVEAMVTLLFNKDKIYDPTEFIKCFCERNEDFTPGKPQCSQDFIRTILRNINEIYENNIRFEDYCPNTTEENNAYKKFISQNKIISESKAYSIFSGILKITITGICNNCGKEFKNYSFNNFVDQIIYLDSFNKKCKFSEVLAKNIGQENKVSMNCPKCDEKIKCKSVSKFIKIPEIFIFTLERFLVRKTVPVVPDEDIDISDLIDETYIGNKKNAKYKLFAVNIRIGKDLSFGHEICQIRQKNNWYTINDGDYYPIQKDYNEYSYGLFYRKINIIDK